MRKLKKYYFGVLSLGVPLLIFPISAFADHYPNAGYVSCLAQLRVQTGAAPTNVENGSYQVFGDRTIDSNVSKAALEKRFSDHPHGEGLFIAYPPTKARNYALFFTSEGAFRVDAKNVITSLDPNAISGIQEGFGKVKIPGVPNDFNFAFGDSQGGHTSSSYSSVDPKTGQVVNFSEQHEMPSYFEDESGWDGFKKQQVKDLGTAEPFADSDELLKFSLNAALKNIDFEIEEKKKNGRYKDSKDELKLDSRALSSCNVPDAAMQRQIDARVANLNSLTQPFGRFRALPNDTAVSAGSMGGEKP